MLCLLPVIVMQRRSQGPSNRFFFFFLLCHWEAEKEKRKLEIKEQQKGGERRAEGRDVGWR